MYEFYEYDISGVDLKSRYLAKLMDVGKEIHRLNLQQIKCFYEGEPELVVDHYANFAQILIYTNAEKQL